jgi:AcrR family transcriptional regulator
MVHCGSRTQGIEVRRMAETTRTGRKGRAADKARVSAPRGAFPLPSTRSSLPPTARRLLEAARRLIEQSGYRSLTYTAIGREAGLSPNLVTYHFGSKAGLLVALLDWLMYDTLWEVGQQMNRLPADANRVTVFMQDPVGLLANIESYRLYYDLLPHVLDDASNRAQLAQLFRSYTASNVAALLPSSSEAPSAEVKTLAALTIAMTDGLAVQLLADPDSVDVPLAMQLWEGYVDWVLDRTSKPKRDA